MMENISYYVFLLVLIITGCAIIKKVASCMVKTVVFLVLLAILAFVYFFLL